MGVIDVVIEDGSHKPPDQIAVFEELYSAIQPYGVYLVEDLHTAYWSFHYDGGLKRPGTMIEYIKDLLDELHTWHHESEDGSPKPEARRVIRSLLGVERITIRSTYLTLNASG